MQSKIRLVQDKARDVGMDETQVKLLLGMIDHESGGTWDENVTGDGGCSRGIAQWNKCAKRIAPETFNEQVDLIVEEMDKKFREFDNPRAVSKHNGPALDFIPEYYSKVLVSSEQFNYNQ